MTDENTNASPSIEQLATQITLPLPHMNMWSELVIVTQPNQATGPGSPPPSGTPGIYTARFVLCIPGKAMFTNNLNLSALMKSGESLLGLAQEETYQYHHTVQGRRIRVEVALLTNDKRCVSAIVVRLPAADFRDAEVGAHLVVYRILSQWSLRHDVAIDVSAYEVVENKTQTKKYRIGILAGPKALNSVDLPMPSRQHEVLASAYREAMNSTNVFYQFLNFYKIVEAIRKIRVERTAERRTQGLSALKYKSRIPSSLEDIQNLDLLAASYLMPYLGKKFGRVIDGLEHVLRNAVAHLDPRGELLTTDDFVQIRRCTDAIPIVKYIAREMLIEEMQLGGAESPPVCK